VNDGSTEIITMNIVNDVIALDPEVRLELQLKLYCYIGDSIATAYRPQLQCCDRISNIISIITTTIFKYISVLFRYFDREYGV
jgi:hypothetical protein